jgi:orotidine-5'-phosphate decarboxylase
MKIIVALDGMRFHEAEELAKKLSGKVWGFKLNDLLWDYQYWSPRLLRYGKIMADPKLYDIPNTVTNCVKAMVNCGAEFITVHTSAGKEVLKTAVDIAGSRILAVTALTSFTDEDTMDVYGVPRSKLVVRLANLAVSCGVSGLVCSCQDLESLKEHKVIKVCPGIRLDSNYHDQKTVGNGIGADFAVIGRAITRAKDPVEEINKYLEE